MSYMFYLGDTLLPVAPEKLELKIANQNKTITLINDGEVNILKSPGLTKVSFDVLLPNFEYPFAVYDNGFQAAETYLNEFEKLKTSRQSFAFRVMRTDTSYVSSFDTLMTVSLEDYTITEDVEKYGRDISVAITLLQYKGYTTKTITFTTSSSSDTTKAASVSTQRDSSSKTSTTSYTVKSGDSLWSIAKSQLNDGSRYKEIYTLNESVIEAAAKKHGRSSSSSGKWIYPGTVLSLPE